MPADREDDQLAAAMTPPQHPANDDDERLAALARSGALSEDLRPQLRAIAAEAAERAETPVALVTFIGADSAWVQAATGLAEGEISRHAAFCAWAIHSLEVLWVDDTILDIRYSDNPLVLSDPFIRFYAGAPIVTPEGYALGAICVMDYAPRTHAPQLSDLLSEMACRVADSLAAGPPN